MIDGIDFINVFVTDFDRSVAFYRDVLGLTPGLRYGELPGLEFAAGNGILAVFQCDAVGIQFTPNTHPIALKVPDVAEAQKRLEARGITFRQTIDSGVCNMAFFDDPDGNALMLHHRYAPDDAC